MKHSSKRALDYTLKLYFYDVVDVCVSSGMDHHIQLSSPHNSFEGG